MHHLIISLSLALLCCDLGAENLPAALRVTAIAAGGGHTLAVTTDGTVWAWGLNNRGQLGDGTNINQSAPIRVKGLGEITAVAAGGGHSLALAADGTVWAWGYGEFGQLGDGAAADRWTPVQVRRLTEVAAIAAGGVHSLALMSDGTVWAWGGNRSGQLGNGETKWGEPAPVQVSGLDDVVAIAAGSGHSLALKTDGTLWAWGQNEAGQLGNGTTTPQLMPVQVKGIAGMVGISAGGGHSVAMRGDGTVWGWGSNYRGAVGDGTLSDRLTPVQVTGIDRIVAVTGAGGGRTLAVSDDGTVWAWGGNEVGGGVRTTPVQVPGLEGVVAVSGGYEHSVALKRDGALRAWGANRYGQLGNGAVLVRSAPKQVAGVDGVIGAAGVQSGSTVLKGDGTVWEWGAANRGTPARVPGISDVKAVAGFSAGTSRLALTHDGRVWQWWESADPFSVSWPDTDLSTPVMLNELIGIVAVATSQEFSLALKDDGTVWQWWTSWQWPWDGGPPAEVGGLSDVAGIAIGSGDLISYYALAVKSDGAVLRWSSLPGGSKPVELTGITGVRAVATGYERSLLLKRDGTVWDWNWWLGSPPTQVSELTGVVAIACGVAHDLALMGDGTVWAWGDNRFGASSGLIGDGTMFGRPEPVQVAGLSDIVAIAVGSEHSLAVKRDGTVWAWGRNSAGQLGDEPPLTRTKPVEVIQPGSPDLAITMDRDADFEVGTQAAYRLAITNTGSTATGGNITLTNILPPGLAFVSATGDGWTCWTEWQVVTCTSPGPFGPGVPSTVILTVAVGEAAWPGVTNLATVANEGDRNASNNTIGDPTVVRRPSTGTLAGSTGSRGNPDAQDCLHGK